MSIRLKDSVPQLCAHQTPSNGSCVLLACFRWRIIATFHQELFFRNSSNEVNVELLFVFACSTDGANPTRKWETIMQCVMNRFQTNKTTLCSTNRSKSCIILIGIIILLYPTYSTYRQNVLSAAGYHSTSLSLDLITVINSLRWMVWGRAPCDCKTHKTALGSCWYIDNVCYRIMRGHN